MPETSVASLLCTSTRFLCRASSGTSTASTSQASSWARSWQRNCWRRTCWLRTYPPEATDGPGNVQPQHPQVPQDGGGQLAARDGASRSKGDAIGQAEGRRDRPGEDDAGDPEPGSQGALRRRDQTKIALMNKAREFDQSVVAELKTLLGE